HAAGGGRHRAGADGLQAGQRRATQGPVGHGCHHHRHHDHDDRADGSTALLRRCRQVRRRIAYDLRGAVRLERIRAVKRLCGRRHRQALARLQVGRARQAVGL
ncbi:MAG: hypothetical protein ACK559_21535, partial [bacterium]